MTGIQNELTLVVHQRLLQEGFDYDPRVRCGPSGTPFTYSCDVLILNPPRHHHVEWTEAVVCRATPLPDVPRCSSSPGGYSLQ